MLYRGQLTSEVLTGMVRVNKDHTVLPATRTFIQQRNCSQSRIEVRPTTLPSLLTLTLTLDLDYRP